MGNIIKFPSKRIVRQQPTPKQIESESKRKKAKENYFIEQLSEEIVLHMIHVFQDHAGNIRYTSHNKETTRR